MVDEWRVPAFAGQQAMQLLHGDIPLVSLAVLHRTRRQSACRDGELAHKYIVKDAACTVAVGMGHVAGKQVLDVLSLW